ncbi:hypothetical protein G7Y79_00017g042530 [Physcia stellaris]|nr:hypothetical protein G7Y79_00017g042530 [Physcia stellaris]
MEIYHTVAYDFTDCIYQSEQRSTSQVLGDQFNDHSTIGYTNPYESTTTALATHANNSRGMTHPPVTGYGFHNATPYQHIGSDYSYGPPPATSFQPAAVASSSATAIANGRLFCPHLGCTATFGRQCELNRHARNHQVGPKDLDCPVRDCRRKGANGFPRKDKLRDHLKRKHKWQTNL